jgi:hypothetical protein
MPVALTSGVNNIVSLDSAGNFAAFPVSPLAAKSYIWAVQLATNAQGVIKEFSTPVQVTAAPTTTETNATDTVTITQPVRESAGYVSGAVTTGGGGSASSSSSGTGNTIKTVQLQVSYAGGDGSFTPLGPQGVVDSAGAFSISATLHAGDKIRIHTSNGDSADILVQPTANQREHFDFIAGALISESENNFSQADAFLALNADREWVRSRAVLCYDYSQGTMIAGAACTQICPEQSARTSTPTNPGEARRGTTTIAARNCISKRHAGINSFFQARLTSIPVNSTTSTTITTSGSSSGSSMTTPSLSSFLTSQKSGHFEAGFYFPFTTSPAPVRGGKVSQTFYLAPIGRFGFNTLAGGASSTTTTSTTSSGSSTITTTPTQLGSSTGAPLPTVYNFWVAGMRFGTAELQPGGMKTMHYLDISTGKFSNLQNLYCPGGSCPANGTNGETRYTPFRLSFEGYLELPDTGFIVGMSANVGLGAFDRKGGGTDVRNRAASDVRFLFAYRFDAAKLIQQLPMLK